LPRQAGEIRSNEIMTGFDALRDHEGNEAVLPARCARQYER